MSSSAAALPRRSFTVPRRISPTTEKDTVDTMAGRWLPAVR